MGKDLQDQPQRPGLCFCGRQALLVIAMPSAVGAPTMLGVRSCGVHLSASSGCAVPILKQSSADSPFKPSSQRDGLNEGMLPGNAQRKNPWEKRARKIS